MKEEEIEYTHRALISVKRERLIIPVKRIGRNNNLETLSYNISEWSTVLGISVLLTAS